MRILVVEDEPDVADLLKRAMEEATWAVDAVGTGSAALQALASNDYDLAVLDLGLPDMSGLEVCRLWRQREGATPILMLTARGALSDRVTGLDAGADDYLTKPFAIVELLARLRALARRPPTPLQPELRVGDLVLDPAMRTVQRAGVPVHLTAREFALLEYLMRNAGRVVSRAQILEKVWDDNFESIANVVDVLVGRVRRKIEQPDVRPLIHTMRAVGYVLAEHHPADGD